MLSIEWEKENAAGAFSMLYVGLFAWAIAGCAPGKWRAGRTETGVPRHTDTLTCSKIVLCFPAKGNKRITFLMSINWLVSLSLSFACKNLTHV